MARAAKKEDGGGQVQTKDFDLVRKLYLHDIKPAKSKAAEFMQESSTAYKAVKKQAHVQPWALRVGSQVFEMEEAKGEDALRCLEGVVNTLFGRKVLTFHGTDMVDEMERPKPQLVAVPVSDGTETDLADAAE